MSDHNNFNPESAVADAQNSTTKPSPTPDKKSHTGCIVAFLALILMAVIGYAAYNYYMSNEDVANAEMYDYEALDGNETLSDYEAYLEKYADSPRAREVRERYEELQRMYATWRGIAFDGTQRDYSMFIKNYPKSKLALQCEVKIDSLDWLDAKAKATPEALAEYLRLHPNGLYANDAMGEQNRILDATATSSEKLMIESNLEGFFRAYGANDPASVFTYITPTMERFLSRTNATKADVAEIIERTYNEHIRSCKFVLNDDYRIKKISAEGQDVSYVVSFSVDQHIDRDNEGKTFGSYTAEAVITSEFKISSLTMKEVSRK